MGEGGRVAKNSSLGSDGLFPGSPKSLTACTGKNYRKKITMFISSFLLLINSPVIKREAGWENVSYKHLAYLKIFFTV
jgi:hypothetical protein